MKRSRFTETQIISILKEADAGMQIKQLCRKHGISDATYYNWKSKYGGMSAPSRLVQCTTRFPLCARKRNFYSLGDGAERYTRRQQGAAVGIIFS